MSGVMVDLVAVILRISLLHFNINDDDDDNDNNDNNNNFNAAITYSA